MFVSFKVFYLRNYGNIVVDRFNGCILQWMLPIVWMFDFLFSQYFYK
jgi:hypothetical protein